MLCFHERVECCKSDGRGHRAAEAGFDLSLLKPIETGVYQQFQVLVEESGRLNTDRARLTLLRENTISGLKSLASAHIQTAYTMLYVARTTEHEATKARCLAKARRICDQLTSWTTRYPYLRDLRDDLEDLIRPLPL